MSPRLRVLLVVAGAAFGLQIGLASAQQPRNVILFVPDGLRALQVTPETAPTMAAVRDQGVNFANPHSLFPTFTMANASGLATGHFLGDTGVFSNTIYTAYPVGTAGGSMTPFIESDPILGDIDAHFSGNFVDEDSILFIARLQGFSIAAIGKLGPALMFDHTERTGENTIIVDDSTGSSAGIPLSQAMKDALTAAGLPLAAPSRGDNGKAGNDKTAGTTVANVVQQGYFASVAAKVVLPMVKAHNRPFVLVFWSRNPDGTQHNQGDSLLQVTPGINGPTSHGSDLVYIPGKDRALTAKVVETLLAQDYVSGLFVDSEIGAFPGTLPLSAINMQDSARTPRPSVVINFRSYSTGCEQPVLCTVEIADTGLQQGQGMHGSFSRDDTMNFMAAIGPSFKSGFVNDAPVSNADMGKTIAHILGLKIPFKGALQGRVVEEALPGGANPAAETWVERAHPAAEGLATVLTGQRVGNTRYVDAAGFPGRTVGLDERKKAASR
jgi:hypothetical protein